jgi:TerC family integral membrane protein
VLASKDSGSAKVKRNVRQSTYAEDVKRTLGWVGAAAAFSVGIALTQGTQEAIEFCSGYVLEYCLSVDNLFVFLVLFDYFNVKESSMRDKVLGYGIWGAVILRGLFVGAGAAALQQSSKIYLLFAAVLAFSSFKILFASGDEEEDENLDNNTIVNLTKSVFKTTSNFDGDNFFTKENGINVATPLLLCLVCVELSDVVFAFDSVPAVFGVTNSPFVVFSSNMFAIAGLRSLFGVLSQAVADLEYLEKSVGAVLAVISLKLGAEAFDVTLLSPLQSLVCVLTILGFGIAASLAKDTKDT